MSSFAELESEHRRLCILRLLEKQAGYRANESVLHGALAAYGQAVSRDQVRTDLGWLDEQGLVSLEDLEGLKIVTARERGVEAARGTITVPGVKRPSARR